jgi:tripartite-type tricarboxylate transporter receptor subunit TctC
MFDTLSSSIEHIRAAGRLRARGVTSAMRLDVLPDIPTVAEAVPGYEASIWFDIGGARFSRPNQQGSRLPLYP